MERFQNNRGQNKNSTDQGSYSGGKGWQGTYQPEPAAKKTDTWVCPNDETINSGDYCVICGMARPVESIPTKPKKKLWLPIMVMGLLLCIGAGIWGYFRCWHEPPVQCPSPYCMYIMESPGGKFCPKCGTSLDAVICRSCGENLTDVSGKFCPKCGTPTSQAGPNAAGAESKVFTGKAQGMFCEIVADVTVSNGKIVNVKLTGDDEHPELGGKVLEKAPAEILKIQSANIDGVAGCTITTDAVRAAVGDALAQAGLD